MRASAFVVASLVVCRTAQPAAAQVDTSCAAVDAEHAAWSSFLSRYTRDGLVDYPAIKATGANALAQVIAAQNAVCQSDYASMTPASRLAFWLNVYNANVVALIIKAYPVDSIRAITPDAFRQPIVHVRAVPGAPLTLDAVENAIIRAQLTDARVHFALVCAAKSCPPLRPEAYVARRIDEQLDAQARSFIGDVDRNDFDATRRVARLSRIFEWFAGDFVNAKGSVLGFVASHTSRDLAGYTIEYRDYDWSLNTAPAEHSTQR